MRDEDRDDPFEEFFNEIERMMNQMMGPNANFRLEHSAGGDRTQSGHDLHIDIHEADEEVRVVADIPGVDKDAINLQCDGKTLHLEAESENRQYRERISLPGRVDEHTADATYNNGVLEVVFERLDDSTEIDV